MDETLGNQVVSMGEMGIVITEKLPFATNFPTQSLPLTTGFELIDPWRTVWPLLIGAGARGTTARESCEALLLFFFCFFDLFGF